MKPTDETKIDYPSCRDCGWIAFGLITFLLILSVLFGTVSALELNEYGDYIVPPLHDKLQPIPKPTVPLNKLPMTPMAALVIDKTKATLTVSYPSTNMTYTTPVLIGKNKGDTFDWNTYNSKAPSDHITPAGTFTVKKVHSVQLDEDVLAFIVGTHKIGSIHPTWMGNPNQNRVKRLLSATPDDNRITNGCVNIDPKFYQDVLTKVPDGSVLTILPESK